MTAFEAVTSRPLQSFSRSPTIWHGGSPHGARLPSTLTN